MPNTDDGKCGDGLNQVRLSPEQETAFQRFCDEFDPVEAEAEYRDMMEHGGVAWEDLLRELDVIDRRVSEEKP